MKIWHSTYQLCPKGFLNSKVKTKFRRGAILRVLFDDGNTGFADLCPFAEMGDRPLEHELKIISRRKFEGLSERAMALAKKDALARGQKVSLYIPDFRVKNHYLIADILNFDFARMNQLEASGYSEFKVKMGRDLVLETEALEKICAKLGKNSTVRLDFNAILNRERFVAWFDKNQSWLRPKLEFCEDPFVYDAKEWAAVAGKFNIRLALDQAGDPLDSMAEGADIIVLKPAKQDTRDIVQKLHGKNKKFIFTHYMDFPIGQMAAYVETQELSTMLGGQLLSCGLQLQDIYEPFAFQNAIKQDGPYILPPEGTGLGFDAMLEILEWQELG